MAFNDISEQIWSQMQTGSSDPVPYKADFYGDKAETEGIDYKSLVAFLRKHFGGIAKEFNYKDYAGGYEGNSFQVRTADGMQDRYTQTPNNTPFSYKNEQEQWVTVKLVGRLNKRSGNLDKNWGYRLNVNPFDETISITLVISFAGTGGFRKPITETPEDDDYRLDEKYEAVLLRTDSLTDFCEMIRVIFGDDSATTIQKKLAKEIAHRLRYYEKAPHLNYLYANIPEFAFALIPDMVDYTTFEKHLLMLVEYDDTGIFSFFKDSSNAVVNLFRLMCNGNSLRLFKTMKEYPMALKRIYHNLDGTSTINGQSEANYVIFANLLYALCLVNGFEGLEKKTKKFYIGKGYELDSNVMFSSDKELDKIFLQQFTITTSTDTYVETDEFGKYIGTTEIKHVDRDPKGSGAYYSPLDLVMLVDMDSEDKTPVMVPAIFVKAISDKEEWKDIKRNIRIGLDLLAVIIGIATLGTASPLVFALAVVDIGLSTADVLVALTEDELMKTPAGRAFLQNWDHIMVAGGILTAGPALVQSTFRLGAKLLTKATLIETKNFLRGSLLKMILSGNKLITSGFQLIMDLTTEFGRTTLASNLLKLYEEGVVIMKNVTNQAEQYAVLFKNDLLLATDLRGLQKEISSIFKMTGTKLVYKIEAYVLALRKTKSVVNTGAELGEDLSGLTKKWGTVSMKLLKDDYAEVVEMLKKKGIELVETNNLKDVYYQVTKIIDKKRKVIRIERKLSVHPEMRYLDLQHELDHIIQFEETLKGEFCTSVRFDGMIQEASATKVNGLNRLRVAQLEFLEFENRVREIRRLKLNDVPKEVLDKHIDGISIYKKAYESFKKTEKKWIEQYFPDFDPNY